MTARLVSGLFAFMMLMQTAHAEEITPWNFSGIMPKEARVIQLTSAQVTKSGLAISTESDGYIIWADHPIEGPVDVITIRARSTQPTKASILWEPKGAVQDAMVQVYANIPGGGIAQNTDVLVSGYPQWNWKTPQFAIAFPAGSNIVIEEIQFRHWPLYERIGERWKSFWTFDTFRPYSINFLWGPLVAGNTPTRTHLYESLPPVAPSVTRYFYVFLGIVAVVTVIVGIKKEKRALAFGWFLAAFVIVWMIFDIRMGAEILSYAVHDVKTYVLPEPSKKILRNFYDIYARVDAMVPTLRDHDTIALLSPAREVYDPVLRYRAYPSAVINDPAAMTGATAWVVFDRPDVRVDGEGYLRQQKDATTSTILAGPGHTAITINENNFLFVVP